MATRKAAATAKATSHVYQFGTGRTDGNAAMRDLLGGKGANLAEMSSLGLPVPPGFTITTEVCTAYYQNGGKLPDGLEADAEQALAAIGKAVGMTFGDEKNPLLVSVRSGARASMPGMMDTILNLGLNDRTVEGLAKRSGDARFAWDSYRRFIQMYSNVVLEVDHGEFEDILENHKNLNGLAGDTDLSADDWKEVVAEYDEVVQRVTGKPFPQDVKEQLWGAIGAVFGSWQSARAKTYRRLNDIPDDWGTAVNVQAMVFGNMGDTSATGVAFTRNPSTGAREVYGEFLLNAQGEDVVAGIRTPQNITKAARVAAGDKDPSLEEQMPATFAELADDLRQARAALRRHAGRRVHDPETASCGCCRRATASARPRPRSRSRSISSRDGVHLRDATAVMRVDPSALDQLLHPTIDAERGQGPAHHGAACLARCGLGRDRVHIRTTPRSPKGKGRERDPGAHRDEPGRHPRHARRDRHSHRARRHDQPRRGGRARHGPAVRVRRGCASDRLCRPAPSRSAIAC